MGDAVAAGMAHSDPSPCGFDGEDASTAASPPVHPHRIGRRPTSVEDSLIPPLDMALKRLRMHHAVTAAVGSRRRLSVMNASPSAEPSSHVPPGLPTDRPDTAVTVDGVPSALPSYVRHHDLFAKVVQSCFSDDPLTNHALRTPGNRRDTTELQALITWLQQRPRFKLFSRRQLLPLAQSMQLMSVEPGQRLAFQPGQIYIVLSGSVMVLEGTEWSSLSIQQARIGDMVGDQEWRKVLMNDRDELGNGLRVGQRLGSLLTRTRARMQDTASNDMVTVTVDGGRRRRRQGSASSDARRSSSASLSSAAFTMGSIMSGDDPTAHVTRDQVDSFLERLHDKGSQRRRRSSVENTDDSAAMIPILRRLTMKAKNVTAKRFIVVSDDALGVVPGKSLLDAANDGLKDYDVNSAAAMCSGVQLVRMTISAFKRALQVKGTLNARAHAEFLKTHTPCFRRWHTHALSVAAHNIEIRDYSEGQVLWEQDTLANEVLVVRSGTVVLKQTVEVSQTHRWPVPGGKYGHLTRSHTRTLVVRTEGVGGVIGEEAALLQPHQPRTLRTQAAAVPSELIGEELVKLRAEEAARRRLRRRARKASAARTASMAVTAFAKGMGGRHGLATRRSAGPADGDGDGNGNGSFNAGAGTAAGGVPATAASPSNPAAPAGDAGTACGGDDDSGGGGSSSSSSSSSSDSEGSEDEEELSSRPPPLVIPHPTAAIATSTVQVLVLTQDFLRSISASYGTLRILQRRGRRCVDVGRTQQAVVDQFAVQQQVSALVGSAVGPRYGQRHDLVADIRRRSPSRVPHVPPTPYTEAALLSEVTLPVLAADNRSPPRPKRPPRRSDGTVTSAGMWDVVDRHGAHGGAAAAASTGPHPLPARATTGTPTTAAGSGGGLPPPPAAAVTPAQLAATAATPPRRHRERHHGRTPPAASPPSPVQLLPAGKLQRAHSSSTPRRPESGASAVTYRLTATPQRPPVHQLSHVGSWSANPKLSRRTLRHLPEGVGVDMGGVRARQATRQAFNKPAPPLKPCRYDFFNRPELGYTKLRLAERPPSPASRVDAGAGAVAARSGAFASASPCLVLRTSRRDTTLPRPRDVRGGLGAGTGFQPDRRRRLTTGDQTARLRATPVELTQSKVLEARPAQHTV